MDNEAELMVEGKVEESGGKKLAKMKLPSYFQGHTFAVDFGQPGKTRPEAGPYRIEFVLGSEFILYRSDIQDIDLDQGYSNLELGESMAGEGFISLYYIDTSSGKVKDTTLKLRTCGSCIQRFVIVMPEDKIDVALHFAEQIIYSILDLLSFQKHVPLQIRQIDMFHEPSGVFLRRYVTVPYTINRYIETKDFELQKLVPRSLQPILRVYREAISSSNPHHRLICLYEIREMLRDIQGRNNAEVKNKGGTPRRVELRVSDNDVTRRHFPEFVGKKANVFLDHIRDKYRNVVAHFEFDKKGRIILDPSEVRSVHKIDCANVVLDRILHQLIVNELKFMQEHKLK